MAAVFQLLQPIGFDAPDEMPVSLLIFLLVPKLPHKSTWKSSLKLPSCSVMPACAGASKPLWTLPSCTA